MQVTLLHILYAEFSVGWDWREQSLEPIASPYPCPGLTQGFADWKSELQLMPLDIELTHRVLLEAAVKAATRNSVNEYYQ